MVKSMRVNMVMDNDERAKGMRNFAAEWHRENIVVTHATICHIIVRSAHSCRE